MARWLLWAVLLVLVVPATGAEGASPQWHPRSWWASRGETAMPFGLGSGPVKGYQGHDGISYLALGAS